MTWLERRRQRKGFWQKLPPLAFAIFLLAVFCLFASFGFIGSIGAAEPRSGVLYAGIYSGVIATGFAWLGVKENYLWMIPWGLGTIVGWPALQGWLWPQLGPAAHALPASFASVGAGVAVILGYGFFILLIATEGRRRFKLEAEVNLAGKIHRGLAPAIDRRVGGYQFAGSSRASGQVGGDLLDLVQADGGWFAYIADVAGHGVAAGVLMGVVKSAVHTWWSASASHQDVLRGLNAVLTELLPEETYVTVAALTGTAEGGLRYAAAGHPPLLHYHAATGEVGQLGVENFPLGLFTAADFASVAVAAAPGDVLAMYTDGLVEIFAPGGAEFGLAGLSEALRQHARQPLRDAVAGMMAAARAFGAQTDDQTLMLVRRL